MSGQYDHWYFFSDSPLRRAAYKRYIREMARGINAFLEKNDYYPVLIGMERLDEKACRDLKSILKTNTAICLSGDYPASVMSGVLRELSALVTSRYHAAVLSMEKGCPIIAVSMDERLDSLMKELSYDKSCLFSVKDKELGRKIYKALSATKRQQASILNDIRTYTAEKKRELSDMGSYMKNYLEEYQDRIRSGKL